MPLDRPIPAFYCCYLLRSTVRLGSVYIGSTPNPVRRLRQHNGLTRGGATRTSRESLRPWEMTCIVAGFPSQIAALQFEWAWQNPHITTRIPSESRLQHATQKKASGKPRRPPQSIASVVSNLRVLLSATSFSRWPLEVRFFSEDVHKVWLTGSKLPVEPIRDSIRIIQDFSTRESEGSEEGKCQTGEKLTATYGLDALDFGYKNQKPHVEKGKDIIDFEREGTCALCHVDLEHGAGIYTICPNEGCEAVTHLTCLSKHFLKNEEDHLVPIKGNCPSCNGELKWIDLVKESSLRMRGQKEVEKLLKEKRVKKGKDTTCSQAMLESSDLEDDEDDDMEAAFHDELKRVQKQDTKDTEATFGDRWYAISDLDNSDSGSAVSSLPQAKGNSYKASKAGGMRTVVEDSDWDDAEVLE